MSLYLWLKNWLSSEEGQDLIEYALLVVLIAIVCIAAIRLVGPQISAVFTSIAGSLTP
jgi:pilus assembly protein Flp/PilA